jgi:DNA-binding transcriptional MerR regulator
MASLGMTIGEAAVRTQCTPATIRYYEEIGLLRAVGRGANGRRAYHHPDIHRLRFVRRCRDLSFPIDDIRALLDVMDAKAPSCLSARDLTLVHLETVRARRAELEALERTLSAMASSCTEACATGATPDCTMLEGLAG